MLYLSIILFIACIVFYSLWRNSEKNVDAIAIELANYSSQKEQEINSLQKTIQDMMKLGEVEMQGVDAPEVTEKRVPTFHLFTDDQGEFRWNFKGINNRVVADSGESYTTKQNRMKGLNVLVNAIKDGNYVIKEK